MGIVLTRIDERLVHGQIMTSWAKYLKLNRIVVVDDEVYNDEFMREVISYSAPVGIETKVINSSQIDYLEMIKNDSKNTLLLFKDIKNVERVINNGYKINELQIGNVSSTPDRKKITNNVSLSESELVSLDNIIKSGTSVYAQMMHTDKRNNLTN